MKELFSHESKNSLQATFIKSVAELLNGKNYQFTSIDHYKTPRGREYKEMRLRYRKRAGFEQTVVFEPLGTLMELVPPNECRPAQRINDIHQFVIQEGDTK